jgi:hypothetical protein
MGNGTIGKSKIGSGQRIIHGTEAIRRRGKSRGDRTSGPREVFHCR